MTSFLNEPSRIDVHAFSVTAAFITSKQLRELGEAGFCLVDSWPLNVEDYGPNQHSFTFRKGVEYE